MTSISLSPRRISLPCLAAAFVVMLPAAVWLRSGQAPAPSRNSQAQKQLPTPTRPNSSPAIPSAPTGNSPITSKETPPDAGLHAALDQARRGISTLTAEEAALPLNENVTHFAWHPAQDLTARFLSGGGVRFAAGDQEQAWQATFSYAGSSDSSSLSVEGSRAEFLHPDGVREWFDNVPAGIEHGFTLDHRPENGPRLEVALHGMSATAAGDGSTDLLLQDEQGTPRLRYAGLKAWDADGKDLLAAMTPSPGGLAISVDDRGARYPLTIDPLVTTLTQQTGPPVSGYGADNDAFGSTVAFDGDTALVGAPHDSTPAGYSAGSVYSFVRSGDAWALEGKLGSGEEANDYHGSALALEGDTAVIGVPFDGPSNQVYPGSAHIWLRSGGQWTLQAKLKRTGATLNDYDYAHLGWRVALSGDTVALGVPDANLVLVFTRTGTTWNQQQKIIGPAGAVGFGSVALEGDSLVIGAQGSPSSFVDGSVHYYTRSGGAWTGIQLPKPFNVGGGDAYGQVVVLSGDTLMAGAPGGAGAVYVFQKTGQTWGPPLALNPGPSMSNYEFGKSIALDGDLALIGAPEARPESIEARGVVFPARRTDGIWQLGPRLADPGSQDSPKFGSALAMQGTRALIGAAWRVTAGGSRTGDATFYDFVEGTWSPGAILSPGDDASGSYYGQAVAVDGDTLAISAGNESNADGRRHQAVHVFTRAAEGWAHQARLGDPEEPEPGEDDGFGFSLDLSGGTLIVGVPYRGTSFSNIKNGAALIYERTGNAWELAAELDGEGNFGTSVAVEGNTAVIGAPEFVPFEEAERGAAYIYTRDEAGGWTRSASLTDSIATDPIPAVYFLLGRSVAIDGDTILVGAPYSPSVPAEADKIGKTFVFHREAGAWQLETTLVNQIAAGYFGWSVAIDDGHAVISAPSDHSSFQFFSRRNGVWTPGDIRYFTTSSEPDTRVALHSGVAMLSSGGSGSGELLEFADGHWKPSINLGLIAGAVDLDADTLVIGYTGGHRELPAFPEVHSDQGVAWIYDLARTEKYLVQTYDASGDGEISLAEWLVIYGGVSSKATLDIFVFIDTDISGSISRSELAAASRGGKGKAPLGAANLLARAKAFVDLDGSTNQGARSQHVERDEFALMWKPGTPANAIDAYWKRANLPAGYDLGAWLRAKTLPSIPGYLAARQARAERRALAERYDLNLDGIIHRDEFARLLEQEAGITKFYAFWDALAGRRKKQAQITEITIEEFIEAAKFPKVLKGK